MSTSPYEPKPVPPSGHGVTLQTLRKAARNGEPFACLTCYDATTARWLERAGIPVLLVGDTAAEMILGEPGTIHAPLEFMLMITAAVKRGAPDTFVMGDMPFGSYQCDDAEAVRNAMRFLTEGRADWRTRFRCSRRHMQLDVCLDLLRHTVTPSGPSAPRLPLCCFNPSANNGRAESAFLDLTEAQFDRR